MASGVFAQTYRQELALRRGLFARSGALLVAVALVLFPFVVSTQWQSIGVFALIAGVGALGLYLLTGLAGQISLGHAAFLGIGAFTATWLSVDQHLPVWIWLPAAGLAAAAVGGIVGPLAARMRGLYLAVVTVALVFIALYVWAHWRSLTGGDTGRAGPLLTINGAALLSGYSVFGVDLNENQAFWFFCLAVLVLATYAARNIERTRMGRAFISVRERDLAASVAGIPVTRTKVAAFVVSSFYAGVAGALLASYQSYTVPSQFGLVLSISYIAMVVVGGLSSAAGAVIGAAFVTAIPQVVHSLTSVLPFISVNTNPNGGVSVDGLSTLLYGLVIVVVMVLEPDGLIGLWERFKTFWKTWPWSYTRRQASS